jgi:hypothetical protein
LPDFGADSVFLVLWLLPFDRGKGDWCGHISLLSLKYFASGPQGHSGSLMR